ncbi:MAG: hypothetical protein QXW12_02555 [Nitrososphaerota archaeon]
MQKERPFGVTVLAILEIIGGLILIGTGAFIGAAGMMAGMVPYVGWAMATHITTPLSQLATAYC